MQRQEGAPHSIHGLCKRSCQVLTQPSWVPLFMTPLAAAWHVFNSVVYAIHVTACMCRRKRLR